MLDQLEQLTLGCMKCGNCMAVCPVFAEIGEETASPRARVRLIKGVTGGEVELSRRYRELMGICANCRACAAECPSGIEPNLAVLNARQHITLEKGLPLVKRAIFGKAMKARRMFPAGAKLMGYLQRASFIGSSKSPARLILPLMGMKIDRAIPYFHLKTFLDRTPGTVPANNRKSRVAYFAGCATNLLFPEVGESIVGLLNRHGVEVVVPHGQMCCGTPLFNSGDFDDAVYFAERNLRIFSDLDVDAVITGCGSCGLALRQEWRELLGIDVPDEFSRKVYDFAEFLVDCMGVEDLGGRLSGKITYHDPCHLARGMGVREQPRRLLASTGMELVEMTQADRCCGGAGAFSIYHPDLSRKIGAKKAEYASVTGAETIVTGCGSCVMQLREMADRQGSGQEVAHSACVLWEAVRN